MSSDESDSSIPSVTAELWTQMRLVYPVWLTLICRKSIDIVPIMFVGKLGTEYLSASGLATVTANVTGYSVLIGLSGGMNTILNQSYGAKDQQLFNLTVQRGTLILLLACVVISAVL
jgi:multidrug resistance protein, MATE family